MHTGRMGRDRTKGNKNKDRKQVGLARVIQIPTLVHTHLGNLLSSTNLQNLITFLVELRRPRDPLEVATLKIQH